MLVITAFRRLKQEDRGLEAWLIYIVRPCLGKPKPEQTNDQQGPTTESTAKIYLKYFYPEDKESGESESDAVPRGCATTVKHSEIFPARCRSGSARGSGTGKCSEHWTRAGLLRPWSAKPLDSWPEAPGDPQAIVSGHTPCTPLEAAGQSPVTGTEPPSLIPEAGTVSSPGWPVGFAGTE